MLLLRQKPEKPGALDSLHNLAQTGSLSFPFNSAADLRRLKSKQTPFWYNKRVERNRRDKKVLVLLTISPYNLFIFAFSDIFT